MKEEDRFLLFGLFYGIGLALLAKVFGWIDKYPELTALVIGVIFGAGLGAFIYIAFNERLKNE